MALLQTVRQRVAESALDFALNAVWTALFGLCGAIAVLLLRWAGQLTLPAATYHAVIGAAIALAFVVVSTAWVVVYRRRRPGVIERMQGRPGLLDFVADGHAAMFELAGDLRNLHTDVLAIGDVLRRGTKAAQRVNASPMSSKHAVIARDNARRVARGITGRCAKMALHASRYAKNVDVFLAGIGGWVQWARAEGQLSAVSALRNPLEQLLESTSGQVESLRSFRETVEGSRKLSADLDSACQGLIGILEGIEEKMVRQVETYRAVLAAFESDGSGRS